MQLGTRWPLGEAPPEKLTDAVVLAIRDAEAQLAAADTSQLDTAQLDTAQWRWTLTYLESRPVVQLDDGTTIRMGHDGSVTTTYED
jgi:hypothetical protein